MYWVNGWLITLQQNKTCYFLGMKNILLVFTLLFSALIFPSASYAEIWVCSYIHQGESNTFVRKRVGQTFIDPSTENDRGDVIVFENDKQINLHRTYSPMFIDYFAVLLSKEDKKFSNIMLAPPPKQLQ